MDKKESEKMPCGSNHSCFDCTHYYHLDCTDKRTGGEFTLKEFTIIETGDHLIFGWQCRDRYLGTDFKFYEVMFPEVEELKEANQLQEKEIEDWDERYEIIWAILKRKGLAFPETEEDLEHFDKHFDETYLEENIKLKHRIAELESGKNNNY